jgi:GNAT superfamily N-acetyltransferase
MNNFVIEDPTLGNSEVCVPIIRSLPDWFGIEEAIQGYAIDIDVLPTLLAKSGEQVLGFLTLKQHSPYSIEIYVMGVKSEMQRNGIGQALMERAEVYAKGLGIEYLQVKTLGPSNPDENYANTRAFYMAMGFRPLEEFTQIWGSQNPCLILVKRI